MKDVVLLLTILIKVICVNGNNVPSNLTIAGRPTRQGLNIIITWEHNGEDDQVYTLAYKRYGGSWNERNNVRSGIILKNATWGDYEFKVKSNGSNQYSSVIRETFHKEILQVIPSFDGTYWQVTVTWIFSQDNGKQIAHDLWFKENGKKWLQKISVKSGVKVKGLKSNRIYEFMVFLKNQNQWSKSKIVETKLDTTPVNLNVSWVYNVGLASWDALVTWKNSKTNGNKKLHDLSYREVGHGWLLKANVQSGVIIVNFKSGCRYEFKVKTPRSPFSEILTKRAPVTSKPASKNLKAIAGYDHVNLTWEYNGIFKLERQRLWNRQILSKNWVKEDVPKDRSIFSVFKLRPKEWYEFKVEIFYNQGSTTTSFPVLLKTLGIGHGRNCTNWSNRCAEGLECKSKICSCTSTQYFDPNFLSCQPRVSHGENCSDTKHNGIGQCAIGLRCQNKTCSCQNMSEYYDVVSVKCNSKIVYNQNCSQSVNGCVEGLECISEICSCRENLTYDRDAKVCRSRKLMDNDTAFGTIKTKIYALNLTKTQTKEMKNKEKNRESMKTKPDMPKLQTTIMPDSQRPFNNGTPFERLNRENYLEELQPTITSTKELPFVENAPVSLMCSLNAESDKNPLAWFIDEVNLENMTVVLNKTTNNGTTTHTSTLTFSPRLDDDSQKLTCNAMVGNSTGSASLTIEVVRAFNLNITSSQPQPLRTGDPVTLKCELKTRLEPTDGNQRVLTWTAPSELKGNYTEKSKTTKDKAWTYYQRTLTFTPNPHLNGTKFYCQATIGTHRSQHEYPESGLSVAGSTDRLTVGRNTAAKSKHVDESDNNTVLIIVIAGAAVVAVTLIFLSVAFYLKKRKKSHRKQRPDPTRSLSYTTQESEVTSETKSNESIYSFESITSFASTQSSISSTTLSSSGVSSDVSSDMSSGVSSDMSSDVSSQSSRLSEISRN